MPAFPMLRRTADFDAITRRGAVRTSRLLVLRTLRTGRDTTRIGLATPRALGGAVERNRLRRRLRELIRERYRTLPAGWDLLVVARPEAVRATFAELREALASVLERSELEA
jgi:ribonuclease P protein component